MKLDLKNIQWKEFEIGNEFCIQNSKAYHKTALKETKDFGIPYISRTNLNNGLESIVKKDNYTINKKNTIVFGAENAKFFYQPSEYITGNKMYFIEKENLNKYSSLFIQMMLNKSIINCGFGYDKGLIGSRVEKRFVLLPVNVKGEPDYVFMEKFMMEKEKEKTNSFKKYIEKRINEVKNYKESKIIKEIKWIEFKLIDLFHFEKGNQNNMTSLINGNIPLVSAKNGDNGLKSFVTSNSKKKFHKYCLTLNNDGDGGAGISYFQPFDFLLDSHVTALKPKKELNKFILLFISRCITKQRNKFGHGYSLTNNRLSAFKMMLPVNSKNEPDYEFMENYIKKIEFDKLNKYLRRING